MKKKKAEWHEVNHFQTREGNRLIVLTPTNGHKGEPLFFGAVNVLLRMEHPTAGEQFIPQEIEFEFENKKTAKECMDSFETEAQIGIDKWLADKEKQAESKLKEIDRDSIPPEEMARKQGLKLF
jgi:hypothetical protein